MIHALAYIQFFIPHSDKGLCCLSPERRTRLFFAARGAVQCLAQLGIPPELNTENQTSALELLHVFTAPQASQGHLVLSSPLFPITASVLIFTSSLTRFKGYRGEALPAAVRQEKCAGTKEIQELKVTVI